MPKPTAVASGRPNNAPPSLSIVLPCCNEEGNVVRVATQALEVGRRLTRDFEIIIVNDGSRDRTGPLADELARTHANVRVIHHEKNLGYGAAVAAGLRAARLPWVFYTDGDGQFNLNQLESALPLLDRHDVVAGFRLDRKEGSVRRLNGWLWTQLVNAVFGLRTRDVDCAFKIFPREFLQGITLHSGGALISAELLCQAKRSNLSIGTVGVNHLPRLAGQSTGGDPRVIVRAFKELFTLRAKILKTDEEQSRPISVWPGLLVFVLALAVFAPSLRSQFTGWDDTAYTIENPHLNDTAGLSRIWFSKENEQYYPITFTAFWIEHQLFGTNPIGYHAVSVVLHALNALLVTIVLQRMGLRAAPAGFAAALFAVHPVQVMSVAWVAEQKNLLSFLFVMLCMLAWLRSERGSIVAYLLAVLFYIAALLSKSAVLGLPIVLATVDLFMLRRTVAATFVRLTPILLAGVVSALITISFEQKFIEQSDVIGIPDLPARVLLAMTTPWWYLKQLLVPILLSPVYPIWEVSPGRWQWWLPLVAWVACGICLFITWKRMSAEWRGWLIWATMIFLLMIAPVSGLIAYGNMHATLVSDHFLYVACIGPFSLLGFAIQRTSGSSHVSRGILAIGIVGLLSALSIAGIATYRDAIALWSRSVERAPNNPVANLGLGVALRNQGQIDRALPLFRHAAEVRPALPDAQLFVAEIEMGRGDLPAAERTLRNALVSNSKSAAHLDMLGTVLGRSGRLDEAVVVLKQAVEIEPRNAMMRSGLAEACLGAGQIAEAQSHFEELVRLAPGEAFSHLGVATCRRAQGDWAGAMRALQSGLDHIPNDVQLSMMLASFYAAAPVDSLRNGAKAVSIMERIAAESSRIDAFTQSHLLDTLAAAYAEVGRFDEAVAVEQRAATMAGEMRLADLQREFNRRIDLYRQRQPLRLK